MSIKLPFSKNENAVTPVLGVMLMIVVTVILAGAVSSFSGSIDTKDVAPQLTMSVEAKFSDSHITLNHLGGDTLAKGNTRIEIAAGNPTISGYVNMDNVTFAPESMYLRPGDSATIEFIQLYSYGTRAYFVGDEIKQSVNMGTPFRITLIDKVTGQTVYSKQLLMNP
ncbi:MAG: type IV pilin N-terminal domain-containing protein [Methanosarcinaceae archaeon]|nr:type IV pilin N-terminal domain-containing protein [Methanosarcinaceae archaeon]